jgi:hypothetical protein
MTMGREADTAKEWTPQSVRAVNVRATEVPGIKAAREQAPLKRGLTWFQCLRFSAVSAAPQGRR